MRTGADVSRAKTRLQDHKRAAEVEVLGYDTAGSGGSERSDLAQATTLALAMETQLGFASEHPLLYRSADDANTMLQQNLEVGSARQ